MIHGYRKKMWWRPSDKKMRIVSEIADVKLNAPLSDLQAQDTGEGTRYGRRPRRPDKKHVQSKGKPVQ